MFDLPFVDAHVHLWDLGRLRYAWLTPPFDDAGPNGNVAPIASTYLLDDYLAEAANWNVAGIVHVDAGADAAQARDETDWLQAMADQHGMPSGIVAFAALDDPDLEPLLAYHAAQQNVRGIRHIVNWHADPHRTYTARDVTGDEAWQRGYSLLGKYRLSFDLQAYPAQLAVLAPFIARHSEIPVIVNHAGMGIDGEADWRAGMRALAALPHVAVKLSGFGFAFRPLDPVAVRGRILATIDLFGADRCLFASDFPTDRLWGTFDNILDNYAEAIADFTDAERRALWGRNANRIYRLGLDI